MIRLRNQANLDVAVRDVCCLLDTPPWNLGIVATAKGLIAGPLTIKHRDGSVTDCMASSGEYALIVWPQSFRLEFSERFNS